MARNRRKIKKFMAQTYALKYLTQAAISAPKDLLNSYIARYKPIHPTVLIFQCTFVCDARCEMCSNWQRGDRKSDMTLEQIDRALQSPLWKNIRTIHRCAASAAKSVGGSATTAACCGCLTRLPTALT